MFALFKMKRMKIDENSVRIIKISKNALFEFIYEKMIDDQEILLDVDPSDVMNSFDINFERGELIFCAYKSENSDGGFFKLPEEIDLQKLMHNIPDTTTSLYQENRYKEYTKEELVNLSVK